MAESSWNLTSISDEPIEKAELFGFDKKSDELMNFLVSKKTVTPFVMAIHGEWGSGKSSLLLTTKKKIEGMLEEHPQNTKIVYFDAWKYESANPAAGLVYHMIKPIEDSKIVTAMNVGKLVIDVISRKTMGITLNDMKNHFEQSVSSVEELTKMVRNTLEKQLPGGRLIVCIDDLDRCTIESTLDILDSIKLFLSLPQCVFILAVDMKKIELAWKSKYGHNPELVEEGTSYLEKIFQMRTSIPPKTDEQITKYVQTLVKDIPFELAEIIGSVGPKNLRKIKRFLNLASFLSTIGKEKFLKYELAIIWVLFEYLMMTNERAIVVAKEMKNQTGYSFIKWICNVLPQEPQQCQKHLVENAAFRLAKGVPSHNDENMFQLLTRTKKLIEKNGGFSAQIEDSFDEIITAAEESRE